MIPRRYIIEWKSKVNWINDAQVEQDLIISRALTSIFSNKFLSSKLAFRGGTALYKLHLSPQTRYSEDIDLVQINSEQIKDILIELRQVLSFMGDSNVKQKKHNNTLIFKFDSEIPPIIPMKLKIEINCKEHFSVLGYKKMNFNVFSGWFKSDCNIVTYHIEELMGTKLRALYQRKKGRDLYDLYKTMIVLNPNIEDIIKCYKKYMKSSVKKCPSKKEFLKNVRNKLTDRDFKNDLNGLLSPDEEYDPNEAGEYIIENLIKVI